jgi:hypothetical protein
MKVQSKIVVLPTSLQNPARKQRVTPSGYLLTTTDAGILPGSRVTQYVEQKKFMREQFPRYRVGDARELCIVAFGGAFIGKKLFPRHISGDGKVAGRTSVWARVKNKWTQEKEIDIKGKKTQILGNQICLGNLSEQGLGVTFYKDKGYFDYLGLFGIFST